MARQPVSVPQRQKKYRRKDHGSSTLPCDDDRSVPCFTFNVQCTVHREDEEDDSHGFPLLDCTLHIQEFIHSCLQNSTPCNFLLQKPFCAVKVWIKFALLKPNYFLN